MRVDQRNVVMLNSIQPSKRVYRQVAESWFEDLNVRSVHLGVEAVSALFHVEAYTGYLLQVIDSLICRTFIDFSCDTIDWRRVERSYTDQRRRCAAQLHRVESRRWTRYNARSV